VHVGSQRGSSERAIIRTRARPRDCTAYANAIEEQQTKVDSDSERIDRTHLMSIHIMPRERLRDGLVP
jgi:hypothetical protein